MNIMNLTADEREDFIEGWEAAGGYMDDLESPNPWCCPWEYDRALSIDAVSPYEMGARYWEQVRDEVECGKVGDA